MTGYSVWLVVMPFLVPVEGMGRWVISAVAATLPLVVVWGLDPLIGNGEPTFELALQVTLPNWVCGILGVVVSYQVVSWGTALTAAHREVEQLGSYQLVEKLGEGGMGEVWRAEHRFLARPAAVKFVRRSEMMDPTAIERFEREALATAQLTSPHTVRIFDFGVDDNGSFFYVMELLDGLDLQTFGSDHDPMPVPRAIHIGIQVAKSLAEAHDHGLIHRDIKPANIYLCRIGGEHDVVKVLDFGLVMQTSNRKSDQAGQKQRLTEDGFVTGTPGYLAPEAARGRNDLDHRIDIYSLGCVLFQLVTGKPIIPEENRTGMEILMDHIREQPRKPSEHAPMRIEADFEQLILDCVAKTPEDRPADMRTVLRRLRSCTQATWTEDDAALWWDATGPATPAKPMPTITETSKVVKP